MMNKLTLHQLRCLDAVLTEGSFQAAADKVCRSQPTVFAAVKGLEAQLGLKLLDRSAYRVTATDAGRAFHERTRVLLQECDKLEAHAAQLSMGEEPELNVVVGDLCPMPQTLGLLRRFFDACPGTRLHLHVEAISGPWERLHDGDADLIIHHVDQADPALQCIGLCTVKLIPVVAPGFLPFAMPRTVLPDQMKALVQCIIRDSARHSAPRDFHVLDGARSWTVSDQLMKKEIIVQGMGWGHLPEHLIEGKLRSGALLRIPGRHFPGSEVALVAARLAARPHGPVAQRLWRYIAEQAPWGGAARISAARSPAPRARSPQALAPGRKTRPQR